MNKDKMGDTKYRGPILCRKKEIENIMKNYFEQEVEQITTPPMPATNFIKKKKIKWENLFMAACITACFTLLILPTTYDNAIRKSFIPRSKYETFKEEIPRVIFDASLYFKNKQSG